MRVHDGESQVHTWIAQDLSRIAEYLTRRSGEDSYVIAVDGRSGGGKSTFARELAQVLDAALLSTDDFAWWHSFFDWPEMLIDHGLQPLRSGSPVDYRPPAWIERGREGAITAEAKKFIIVEGVGAGQQRMRDAVDAIAWLQSDVIEAERRGILRDLAERPDPVEAKRFWDEWQAQEVPFQALQRTWEYADLVICGTPSVVGEDPAPRWFCDR